MSPLLVERQHRLDNDLVAALQFEQDSTGRLGSRQLETAVVNFVAHSPIDVFQNWDSGPLAKRVSVLFVSAAVAAIAAIGYPGHFEAFVRRLGLQSAHYPTATRLVGLSLNDLPQTFIGVKPEDAHLAEGASIHFLLACEGALPAAGTLKVQGTSGATATELDQIGRAHV